MATLFDFKDWLQELDLGPTDYEEISQLVHSLRNTSECGLYKTVVAKGVNTGWIVSSSSAPDNLKLTTPKQVSAFIRHIEDTLCEGMDAEVFALVQERNDEGRIERKGLRRPSMIKCFQDFLNESKKIPVVSMEWRLGLCFMLSLFVSCEKLGKPEKSWVKTMEVDLQVVAEGYDGHQTWFQPRVARTDKKNEFSLLLQPWFTEISDYYGTYHEMHSTDGGLSWSNPISLVDSLGDRFKGDTLLRLADVNAQFHERTKTILAIGGAAEYINGHQPGMVDKIGYFSCSSDDRKYSSYRLLEIPSGLDVSNAGYGCSQWVELPDGDILLPIQMWNKDKGQFTCTIARCSFDGHKLCYKSNSNLLAMDRGRGLCELSLIEYMEHYYLTLRNDVNGMVSASKDGKYFSEPKEWKFDTDSLVNIENTQSHWVKSPWGLYLVYTSSHRKESENVFRGRAPLFIAQFDENKMCLLKNTEKILVPNTGAQLGNFGAVDIDESNSWVVTSEATTVETQKVGDNNGRVIIAKILWQ